jgi:anti-sigma B factor antagonist
VIRHELDERTSLVSVEGELDLSSAPQLKWTLLDAIDAGRNLLVLDLSLASFMDSTALGVLIGVNRSLGIDGRMAIACARTDVLHIFELSGTDGMFSIFATLGEALAYIQRQGQVSGELGGQPQQRPWARGAAPHGPCALHARRARPAGDRVGRSRQRRRAGGLAWG